MQLRKACDSFPLYNKRLDQSPDEGPGERRTGFEMIGIFHFTIFPLLLENSSGFVSAFISVDTSPKIEQS